jgi:hypothetical protein
VSATPHENPPELGTSLPERPAKRDALGWFCFYFHFAVMITIVFGWLVPVDAVLVFYLVFLPAVFIQWQFNKNSCVLNNIESLIRTGNWRSEANAEEGAWLLTLATDLTGWKWLTARMIDGFTHAVMASLWLLGLAHLKGWIL